PRGRGHALLCDVHREYDGAYYTHRRDSHIGVARLRRYRDRPFRQPSDEPLRGFHPVSYYPVGYRRHRHTPHTRAASEPYDQQVKIQARGHAGGSEEDQEQGVGRAKVCRGCRDHQGTTGHRHEGSEEASYPSLSWKDET